MYLYIKLKVKEFGYKMNWRGENSRMDIANYLSVQIQE